MCIYFPLYIRIFVDCGVPNPIIGVSIEAGPTVLACELLLECESGYLPENDGITNTSIECQSTGSWSPVQASFNCLKGKQVISYQELPYFHQIGNMESTLFFLLLNFF